MNCCECNRLNRDGQVVALWLLNGRSDLFGLCAEHQSDRRVVDYWFGWNGGWERVADELVAAMLVHSE